MKAFKDFTAGETARSGKVTWRFTETPRFSHTRPGTSEPVYSAQAYSEYDGQNGRLVTVKALPSEPLKES